MAKHPIYRRWRSWGAAAGVACASTILIPGATARPTALPQQSGHVDLLTQANLQIPGAMTGEWAGTWVAAAGDVNGDGLGDVIIASYYADNNGRTDSGSAYVVFGRTSPGTIDLFALGDG